MCHLDNLKVAKQPLPLPGTHCMCIFPKRYCAWLHNSLPMQVIWQDIRKIIDTLHIWNHKDSRCKQMYSPEIIKEEHPTYNTMSCEQTFVWLSRFKKIVCAMQKMHHHFYIHRMVKRRDSYIKYCYMNNHRPLLPNPKSGQPWMYTTLYCTCVFTLLHKQFTLNSSTHLSKNLYNL